MPIIYSDSASAAAAADTTPGLGLELPEPSVFARLNRFRSEILLPNFRGAAALAVVAIFVATVVVVVVAIPAEGAPIPAPASPSDERGLRPYPYVFPAADSDACLLGGALTPCSCTPPGIVDEWNKCGNEGRRYAGMSSCPVNVA